MLFYFICVIYLETSLFFSVSFPFLLLFLHVMLYSLYFIIFATMCTFEKMLHFYSWICFSVFTPSNLLCITTMRFTFEYNTFKKFIINVSRKMLIFCPSWSCTHNALVTYHFTMQKYKWFTRIFPEKNFNILQY
jgi:hypothetical protein